MPSPDIFGTVNRNHLLLIGAGPNSAAFS